MLDVFYLLFLFLIKFLILKNLDSSKSFLRMYEEKFIATKFGICNKLPYNTLVKMNDY